MTTAPKLQRARRFHAADEGEQGLGPVRVVKLERHASDDEQQEAGDDEKMQEALEWHKACKPFIVFLHAGLGFTEFFRVVQREINHPRLPNDGVQAKEGEHADEQAGNGE